VVRISGFALAAVHWQLGTKSSDGPLLFNRECRHILSIRMARTMSAGHFERVAWWYAREEIGRGLREHYGPANDLPPRLQLLVKELDKPRSTRLARLCVLAFIAAIAAASFRFHFVF
jgi:hypothetical protein